VRLTGQGLSVRLTIVTPESIKLLYLTAGAVVSLIVLVAWLRIHAFLALLFAALVVGLGAGLIEAPAKGGGLPISPAGVAVAFQEGMGKSLGGIAAVLGLGTMLGGLLAASGGAEVLAQRLVGFFGAKRVNIVLMIVALAVGFTTWFAVGLIMLLPILLTLTKETKQPFLKLALPMLAVLSIMHGVMPPHPGPLYALDELGASLGKVVLWGLVAAIPIAAVSGPFFARWAVRHVSVTTPEPPAPDPSAVVRDRPSLFRTVAALALPVILILSHTISELASDKKQIAAGIKPTYYQFTEIIGNPILALAVAVLFAAWAFRFTRNDALKIVEKSLGPVGMTLLLVGGGGGFNNVLQASGAADAIGQMASKLHMPTMLFAWVCAALIRIATGSATVAIIAAIGLVKPLMVPGSTTNPELLVVAIGCGAMVLSHVNDAGFWIVKESLQLTVSQTLRTWTVTETLIGITGLGVAWGLDIFF
jgi:GntP family gluconate:H+ symporter